MATQSNVLVLDAAALSAAKKLARGAYQLGLLSGTESLSGSTLKGKARNWGGRYAASRAMLLTRMTEAGIPWCERRGDHAKRILVIGGSK